ncbi:hypothetical protein [Pedobacter sp.]|uniref:hypothetical protein n=1 Tax=Pedobacter sp. TaxID=1411316 RepID=UPI003BAAFEB7
MKTTIKKRRVSYNDFYSKFVEKLRSSEIEKENEERKVIAKDIEKILDGKTMVIHGNMISL